MKKIYVRWLGWHSYVHPETFKFEMSRGTESCAEAIEPHKRWGTYCSYLQDDNPNVWCGLLCKPSGVVREFATDAWSKLSGTRLQRDGSRSGNKLGGSGYKFTHTEAWVKPGNFIGIVVGEEIDCLSDLKRQMIYNAARKYKLPVFVLTNRGLVQCKEVSR